MTNLFTVVGRLVNKPILVEEKNKKKCIIKISTPRFYKNEEGIIENDIIQVVLYQHLAENLVEYCDVGDVVGVKGRIESKIDDSIELIVEKVSFLSSKKRDEE